MSEKRYSPEEARLHAKKTVNHAKAVLAEEIKNIKSEHIHSLDEASKLWDQRIEENVKILQNSIRSYNQKNETDIFTR